MPDHSTFSKNRHGGFRDSDLLRHLFEATVERCLAEGLVGGGGFAVDGSLIRADANRQLGHTELPSEASSRAVREYLDVLDDAAFGGATPVAPRPSRQLIRQLGGLRSTAVLPSSATRPTILSILITASSSMSRQRPPFAKRK